LFFQNDSTGRYTEGRTRQSMDHYASKTKNASVHSRQEAPAAETYIIREIGKQAEHQN
jgi:hypothetical protein